MKKILTTWGLGVIFLFGIIVISGCDNNKTIQNTDTKKINVMVSILPQVDFTERIGGDRVTVFEMIPPGFSPATYDPSPEQLKKLQDADIYLRIGHIPFEKVQMDRLAKINPKMEIIDTSQGINLISLAEHHHEDEAEAEADEFEEQEGNDPHIWLSPVLVKTQAQHIYDALVKFSPQDKEYFTKNYNQFIADLDNLDKNLKQTFLPIAGQTIFVFHPAFGYLADTYGFKQEAIEIEGKDPSPVQLQTIIDQAKLENVKVIFVQSQFSTKSASAVAQEIGGAVVQIDPLAKDYFSNLESMSETIVNNIK